MLVDRRGFLGWCGVIGVSGLLGHARKPRVELWINSAAWGQGRRVGVREGVFMGIDEAVRAATLFGGDVTVRDPRAGDEVFPSYGVWIWIVQKSAGENEIHRLIDSNRKQGIVFNADDSSEAFRSRCERHVFHIAARADQSREGASWSPSLTRFGADTLNKRFTARFGEPMTADAWAGWFAVKCAFEAALRSKASTAGEIIEYLEKPTSRFDGHKGVGLYFDANHELIQPLYLMDGQVVREEIASGPSVSGAGCR